MEIQKVKLQMIRESTGEYNAKIKSPIDIVNFINEQEQYSLAPNESIIVIGLSIKNEIIYSQVATGGVNSTFIKPADIFKPLLVANCSKFILVHNHPSGDSTPSKEDIALTDTIKAAADIMGIEFLDHVVIGDNNYTSIMSIKEVQ